MTFSQTFCRNKWIARRDTRVNKIKSSKCEVLLKKDHEATERIFVNWMKNLHRAFSNQRNESSFEKSHEVTERIFVNETTERIFTKRRESTRMIVNLREWISSLFENDDCILFSLDVSWVCENDREPAIMTVNSRSSYSSKSVDIQSIIDLFVSNQSVSQLCRSSCSSLQHLVNSRSSLCQSTWFDLYNIHLFKRWDIVW